MEREFFGKKGYSVQKYNDPNEKLLVTTWKNFHKMWPSAIETPTSIDEIQALVKKAAQNQLKIKCIGAGHSFTPVAVIDDDGILISLEKMNGIVELDTDYITVQGGCTLAHIVQHLKKHGKQLPACPEFGPFYAGAFSGTQLHDSSGNTKRLPTLSSHVIRYKVIKADGSLENISSELEYWRNNQGLGGIVVEVTFRIMPIDQVVIEYDMMKWGDYWQKRQHLSSQYNEFFTIYIPILDSVFIEKRKYVDQFPPSRFLNFRLAYGSFFRKTLILNYFSKFYAGLQHLPSDWLKRMIIYIGVKGFFRFLFTKTKFFSVGADRGVAFHNRSYEIYNDYMVDENHYPQIIMEMKEFLRTNKKLAIATLMASYPVSQDTNCIFSRTLKGNGYSIDPVLYKKIGSEEHLLLERKIKDIALKYKTRPHLNKVVNLSAELIKNGYGEEQINAYLAWCKRMDPKGVFQGAFYRMLIKAMKSSNT